MEDSIRRQFIADARAAARSASDDRLGSVVRQGIFVVQSADTSPGYKWEIRNRDGTVIERSLETFQTIMLARYAGVRALAGDESPGMT